MRRFFVLFLLCFGNVYADENPAITCTQQLVSNPKYTAIANKFPIGAMTDINFEKLAIKSKPTKKESKLLNDWVVAHNQCFDIGLEYAKANYHPQLIALTIEANNQVLAIVANLFNRELTYGSANKQIQSISDDYRTKVTALVEQIKSERAAQQLAQEQAQKAQEQAKQAQEQAKRDQATRDRQYAEQQQAQAQALADQQQQQAEAQKRQMVMQLFQNQQQQQQNNYNQQMQQIQQNQQIYQNRRPITTNCNGSGNSWTCNSQ